LNILCFTALKVVKGSKFGSLDGKYELFIVLKNFNFICDIYTV